MDKEKQIDEMAEDMYNVSPDYEHNIRSCRNAAEEMYAKGYRKQSEGEWKKTCVPNVFQCTNCKLPTKMDEFCDSEILRAFCPNCGAKMKGESND